MNTPAVSVVIATHNYGHFLGGAVESVLEQTFPDFELVVIDDGSTDDTAAVAASYLGDARVHYHRLPHLKQPRAKNSGIRLARAPLIAFLDADDLWLPKKLERQVACFAADENVGVVYARRRLMDEDNWELEYSQPVLHRGRVLDEMVLTNFVCFSSVMVRREVLEDVGLFDENLELAIDYDLWLRVAAQFRFDYVDEPLVYYRVGHANLSRRHEERLRTAMGIMRRFINEHEGRTLLAPEIVRRAWAETHSSLARAIGRQRAWAAAGWYLRSLLRQPSTSVAWLGLAGLMVPSRWQPTLRRWLGRSAPAMPRRIGPVSLNAAGAPVDNHVFNT